MTTYRRAPGAVDAVIDGQIILLSPVDFSYHALDRVGGRVWALLETPQSDADLITTLTLEFTVDADRCRADLEPFLARMVGIGALVADTR